LEGAGFALRATHAHQENEPSRQSMISTINDQHNLSAAYKIRSFYKSQNPQRRKTLKA
jgi:hypothetical protein